MEGKQTAVEWLVSQVEDFHCLLPVDMIEKAKEMEKEQIIDAHNKGIWPESKVFDDGEEYYNETYLK